MKKIGFILIVLFCFLFTSCYFFVKLDAETVIKNTTDYDFYYLVDYNWSLKPGDGIKAKKIEAHSEKTETLDGRLSKFGLHDTEGYFIFYYSRSDEWEEIKKIANKNEYYLMTVENKGNFYMENTKSQKYEVIIKALENEDDYKVSVEAK